MKRKVSRVFTALFIAALCAVLLSAAALADGYALDKENNWNIAGELIMPGDSFTIESSREVSGEGDIYIYIHGASLIKNDARIYLNYTQDDIAIEEFLKGITVSASATGKLKDLVGEDGADMPLTSEETYSWTTGYVNNTGYPIEIRAVRGYNNTGGCVTPPEKTPHIYLVPVERFGMDFVVYQSQYAISYEDMTEEEIASAPDHYDLSVEEQTLTLPVPRRGGKIFRYYTGRNGIAIDGTVSADGTGFSFPYSWETLKDAGSGFYFGDRTLTPVFADAYTVELDCAGGQLDQTYYAVELEEADAFDLYAHVPTRAGYTFLGWSDKVGADAIGILSRDYKLTDGASRESKFYAVWQKDGWVQDGGKWYYYRGGATQTGWLQDGAWYYLDGDGVMQTGWVSDGGKWYYMNASGAMQTGWLGSGSTWYYLDPSGAMATGWRAVGGTWYYFRPSGAMAVGWVSDGGTWYYFRPSGAMAVGWVSDGGTWYYFRPSGAMAVGWVSDGGTWYYFRPSGAMAVGWVSDGGTWYYFDGSGAMVTGWKQLGSVWYFFKSSGAMAANETLGGYSFDASGAWIG